MKSLYHKSWLLIALFCLLLGGGKIAAAQSEQEQDPAALTSSDAIAVRIVPNPNHYGIIQWYYSQGFVGSPQSLVVDGYEAIRDGRTVYVNAANVDMAGKNIYTNIYLISYTQDQENPTVDILGQLVARWKFNSNLVESGTPTCSFSSKVCKSDSDCGPDQKCSTSGLTTGSCIMSAPLNCAVDTDCPANFFCDSLKAKIARDIRRLGRLNELQTSLADYNWSKGKYPVLAAGTYLPGHSISVWPSWSGELLPQLAVAPSLRDPVNRLGPCVAGDNANISPDFDQVTCWNEKLRKFINEPGESTLPLPAGSYAFVYSADTAGSKYNLCASMESRSLDFRFRPLTPDDSACISAIGIGSGGVGANVAPQLAGQLLIGQPDKEFNGYIQVYDGEQKILSWSWESQVGNPTRGWAGWRNNGQDNQPPRLMETSNPFQKKVYAEKAGQPGVYNMIIRVADGAGGVLTTTTPITIAFNPIALEAQDAVVEPSRSERLRYRFAFAGEGFNNPSATLPTVTKISGPYDILGVLSDPEKTITRIGGKYQVEYSGFIPAGYQFFQDTSFRYNIRLVDSFGQVAQKQFALTVKAMPPTLNFACAGSSRINSDYSCLLGAKQQGGRYISYNSSSGYPTGLAIEPKSTSVYLEGTARRSAVGSYNVTIKAASEFGASSTKVFNLKINDYCGDGLRQRPNTEGRGGLYNNGQEDCDGNDYVVASSTMSSIERQYGCSTKVGVASPYPILNNNHCIFLPPSEGGGYCGDSYCQVKFEGRNSCPVDCYDPANCVPDCDGAVCGNDGCGGTCGQCTSKQMCDGNRQCQNIACSLDEDCNDNNPCTRDACQNPGLMTSACSNVQDNSYYVECGQSRTFNACGPGQTTLCSTGTCEVKGFRYCSGGVLGECQEAAVIDPRLEFCEFQPEGASNESVYGPEFNKCNAGDPGVCLNTTPPVCERSCQVLLSPVSQLTTWNGMARCASGSTTVFDNSSCLPTSNYWYSGAVLPSNIADRPDCFVKLNANYSNASYKPRCNSGALQPDAQWFLGVASSTISGNKTTYFCSVGDLQDADSCAKIHQTNICGENNQNGSSWTNRCYVKNPPH